MPGIAGRRAAARCGWQQWLPPGQCAASLPGLRPLLCGRGSLTQALRTLSRDFAVRVLANGPAALFADERETLGLPHARQAWVREVLLCDGRVPLVFAHTALRRADLAGWPWLSGLGQRPLGEVLFTHPRVIRLPLRFRRLDRRHPLYHSARRATGCDAPSLWARRSLFRLDGRDLLVTEVFLPALLARLQPP